MQSLAKLQELFVVTFDRACFCFASVSRQTPDKGNGNVSRNVDDGDEEKEGQNAFVKTMRGEMVGVNCDFSADIEVKVCVCVCISYGSRRYSVELPCCSAGVFSVHPLSRRTSRIGHLYPSSLEDKHFSVRCCRGEGKWRRAGTKLSGVH